MKPGKSAKWGKDRSSPSKIPLMGSARALARSVRRPRRTSPPTDLTVHGNSIRNVDRTPQERGIYSASRQDVSGHASCLGRLDMLTFQADSSPRSIGARNLSRFNTKNFKLARISTMPGDAHPRSRGGDGSSPLSSPAINHQLPPHQPFFQP